MNYKDILDNMQEMAVGKGFILTDNAEKIAKAKERMFGDDWKRCPCDGNNPLRFCGSKICEFDVKEHGICHCTCFKRVD